MRYHRPQVIKLVNLRKLWVLMDGRVKGVPKGGPCSEFTMTGPEPAILDWYGHAV